MTVSNSMAGDMWPSIPLEAWSDTYATLHLWTQIVGKVRLAQSPWTNHSWHVTLYVTPTGLTTGSIPYGSNVFQIDFNFVEHELRVQCDRGGAAAFPLKPQSVAVFYRRLMEEMEKLDLKMDPSQAQRDPRLHSVRTRRDPCVIRSRVRQSFLARAAAMRSCFQDLSRTLRR